MKWLRLLQDVRRIIKKELQNCGENEIVVLPNSDPEYARLAKEAVTRAVMLKGGPCTGVQEPVVVLAFTGLQGNPHGVWKFSDEMKEAIHKIAASVPEDLDELREFHKNWMEAGHISL